VIKIRRIDAEDPYLDHVVLLCVGMDDRCLSAEHPQAGAVGDDKLDDVSTVTVATGNAGTSRITIQRRAPHDAGLRDADDD
jgi:hypothetical protein